MAEAKRPTDDEIIAAIKVFSSAVVASVKAANFSRGTKGAFAREDKAAKKLLTLVLGREPTDEEVARVVSC